MVVIGCVAHPERHLAAYGMQRPRVQVYLSEYRPPRQQKVEALLRRAQLAIVSVHPNTDSRQLRREGVPSLGWQRL